MNLVRPMREARCSMKLPKKLVLRPKIKATPLKSSAQSPKRPTTPTTLGDTCGSQRRTSCQSPLGAALRSSAGCTPSRNPLAGKSPRIGQSLQAEGLPHIAGQTRVDLPTQPAKPEPSVKPTAQGQDQVVPFRPQSVAPYGGLEARRTLYKSTTQAHGTVTPPGTRMVCGHDSSLSAKPPSDETPPVQDEAIRLPAPLVSIPADMGEASLSSDLSLHDLLDAVQRAVRHLEQIAAATADAQSKRARTRPPARPVDTALVQQFAGKKMLNISEVEGLVGAKRSTVYGWIQKGSFVKPVRLSPKASRWVAAEVEAWLDEKRLARPSQG